VMVAARSAYGWAGAGVEGRARALLFGLCCAIDSPCRR
jgi:hypothetical protein